MRKLLNYHHLKFIIVIIGFGMVVFALGKLVGPVAASTITTPDANRVPVPGNAPNNDACLYCHSKPGMTRVLPNGETLSLTIDSSHFADSAHKGVPCAECHADILGF